MSEEDKKVDPNLEEVVDKTTDEKNEDTDKTDKNEMTFFYQKKAAQEKTAKVEEERDALQAKLDKIETQKTPEVKADTSKEGFALKEQLKAIEFTLAHRELSPDAIKAAISIAKAEGVTNEDALQNPMVKAYIEKLKEEEGNKDAIPTGNRSAVATDEEKKSSEEAIKRARETGKVEDWAEVITDRLK